MGTGTRRPRPDTIRVIKSTGGAAPPDVVPTCPDVTLRATASAVPQLGTKCSLIISADQLRLVLSGHDARILSVAPDKRHVMECIRQRVAYVGTVTEVRGTRFVCVLSAR